MTAGKVERIETLLITALIIAAAIRIFLFIAAFPFFNNVDEEEHFDLVYKYSEGSLPGANMESYCRAAVELILLYGTPEYYTKPERWPNNRFPAPVWTRPDMRKSEQFTKLAGEYKPVGNYQTGEFPFYYLTAGLWCATVKSLGIEDGRLLYWIRFMNIPVFAALVAVSYFFARKIFPDNIYLKFSLPLIVAFWPQDSFYSISNDVLSPLLFALAFLAILQIYFEDKSFAYHFYTGLVIAATLLTKRSNIVVLFVLCVIITLKLRKHFSNRNVNQYLPKLLILLVAAMLPMAILFTRNYLVFGDITASAGKMQYLGWTVKPLSKIWDHPILTPGGLLFFLSKLTETFWRGELIWHWQQLISAKADLFYVITTALFFAASALGLFLRRHKQDAKLRFVLCMSFCTLAVCVLLMAALSIRYDFDGCFYPSREKPYLVSGRLISCAALPFFLIYVNGLKSILAVFKNRLYPIAALAIIVIIITISEILLTRPVFGSLYNWFHLS